MDYFDILDLNREPFSNSPDPAFFYPSGQHRGCLQQLELAIRLRRGLNVVIGHVGTGKTTICRDLIRRFSGEADMDAYLMLDPGTHSDSAFLSTVLELFSGRPTPAFWPNERKKEAIKQFLFEKSVEENHTVTLIIDEGQKITPSCLEVLREFLNYETNEHKLLQIVIFAQKEFGHTIRAHPNFADRINLRINLNPLGLRDTIALIRYRIQVSGGSARRLFSLSAMVAIFLTTQGYPRRIIHLCHRVLLSLIIQNRRRAGWRLVRASARRTAAHRFLPTWRWMTAVGTLALIAALMLTPTGWFRAFWFPEETPVTLAEHASASVGAPHTVATGNKPVHETPPRSDAPLALPVKSAILMDTGPPSAVASESPFADNNFNVPERPRVQMPARLGRLTIHPNETLGQLIQIIYGQFAPSYLNAIAEANPHIRDPDTLNVGDVIHFPALPAAVRPLPVNVWWVELTACQRLDEAVQELKRLKRNRIKARIVPYWNPEQGMNFSLVLSDCFYDHRVAENALNRTPPAVAQQAQVRSLWRDDTVFFSNPFRPVPDITPNHS
jgi:general secretion pathway protein A